MNLKQFIALLKLPNLSTFIKLAKDIEAYVRFHFLHSAFESGLLGFLRKPRTFDQIIHGLNIKRGDILEALLDVGLSLKELKIKNGFYRLHGKRSRAIAHPGGDGLAAMVQSQVTYYNDIYHGMAGRLKGEPDIDNLDEIGNIVARFATLMEPYIKGFIKDIVYKKGPLLLLEIGCGHGIHLKSAIDLNAKIKATGIDMDKNVVISARKNIQNWGLVNNCKVIHGNIMDQGPSGTDPDPDLQKKFDIITLHNIVYYFSHEQMLALFRLLKDLLKDGGAVAITTSTRSHGKNFMSANLDLALRSMKGCYPVPEVDEIAAGLRDSGFKDITITKPMPGDGYHGIVAR